MVSATVSQARSSARCGLDAPSRRHGFFASAFSGSSGRLALPNWPIAQILLELRRVRVAIRESDIAIRTNKIYRAANETGGMHGFLPGKRVQRQTHRLADAGDRRRDIAVDVQLPVEGHQRGKVVGVAGRRWTELDPRQTVATADLSRDASAQVAPAIFDRGLRHGAKHESSRDILREEHRQ